MELLLKNVDPKDFALLKNLSKRLGIQVEKQTEPVVDKPDNFSVADDLREAIAEIKLAQAGKIQLRDAWDVINEL